MLVLDYLALGVVKVKSNFKQHSRQLFPFSSEMEVLCSSHVPENKGSETPEKFCFTALRVNHWNKTVHSVVT